MKELFSSILEIAIVTSIIIALVGILYKFLSKRYDAKWRCIVWVVLAIRLIIPFNMSLDVPTFVIPEPQRAEIVVPKTSVVEKQNQQMPTVKADEKNKAQTSSELAPIMQEKIIPPTVNEQSQNVSMWVDKVVIASYIWLVGMAIILLIKLIQIHLFHRYVKRWGKSVEDKRIQNILHSICFEMGVTEKITPLYCQGIASPMVVGLFKSRLLLPNSNYSDKELYAVLRHELVHIKQHHLWMKVLAMLCEIIYWFNPFAYLMSRLMNKDIEFACDSKVLKLTSQDYKEDYSKAILSVVSRSVGGMRPVLVAGFSEGKKTLMSRFSNIFDGDKKKKGILTLIVVIIAITIIGSFFVFGGKNVKQVNDSLTIYKLGYDYCTCCGTNRFYLDPYDVDDTVKMFKEKYPDVEVNVVDFSETKEDEFYKKLTTELIAGKGPDIIVGDYYITSNKDIYKLMQSGVFAEMDDFIKNDKEFNINDYYPAIMEQGKYQGRQYLMPLRFDFPIVLGAKSKLEKAGVNIENCKKDYIGFLEEVQKYIEKGDGKADVFGGSNRMYDGLRKIGVKATNDNPKFATDEFKRTMELYKTWYPIDTREKSNEYCPVALELKNENSLFSFDDARDTYGYISGLSGFDEPVLIPLRKPGGGLEAHITLFAGINNNSPNQQNAFNFIKTILSPDGLFNIETDIPSNRKLAEVMIKMKNDIPAFSDPKTGIYYFPINQEHEKEMINMMNEVDSAYFATPVAKEIATQLDPFFKSEKTYEECIKKAEEKVKIYLAE